MPSNNYNIILNNKKYFAIPNDLHMILPDPYEYFIMTGLLRYANGHDDGACFPSQDTLKGTMSILKAKMVIKKLIDKGFITRKKTDGKANIYTINYELLVTDIYQYTTDTSIPHVLVNNNVEQIMAWADKKSNGINPVLTKKIHKRLANKESGIKVKITNEV